MDALFDRRIALQGLGALASLAAMPAAARPARKLDLADPATRQRLYMLMRGALDERPVIGCISAQYFGVVDGEPVPLFGVDAMTVARYRRRPDGGYDVFNGEVAYFTDMAAGKALDEWKNPYTGATVKVPEGGVAPSRFIIGADLSLTLSRPIPGNFKHEVQPFDVRGEDVWVSELTVTSVAIPGGPKPFRYAERTTLHTRLSDLQKPGAVQVGAETGFTNIVSWRPWMAMGDRPGHMMAIGAGRYGATVQTLPAPLIAALKERRPEVLANPASLIDPIWKTR